MRSLAWSAGEPRRVFATSRLAVAPYAMRRRSSASACSPSRRRGPRYGSARGPTVICRRRAELPGLPREKALATIVRLLETTFVRIGNAEYARDNESFGLTTLRERQAQINGSTLRLRFKGKSGVPHEITLADRRIARIVRRMQDLPGEELFQYLDEDGNARAIESTDVNAYLKSISGAEFTSKDFRTWAGTLLCLQALRRLPPPVSAASGRREVAQAVQAVAHELRNTRAVCRKC